MSTRRKKNLQISNRFLVVHLNFNYNLNLFISNAWLVIAKEKHRKRGARDTRETVSFTGDQIEHTHLLRNECILFAVHCIAPIETFVVKWDCIQYITDI